MELEVDDRARAKLPRRAMTRKAVLILNLGVVGLMPLRNCWRRSCRQGLAGPTVCIPVGSGGCCLRVSAGRWQKSRWVYITPELGGLYRRVRHAEVGVPLGMYAEYLFEGAVGSILLGLKFALPRD